MKRFITKLIILCLLFFLCSCEGMDGLVKKNPINSSLTEIIYSGSFELNGPGGSLQDFNYTHISVNLEISGTSLQQLNELEVLLSVEGDIVIENNSTLNNLNGIGSLEFVGGDIRFENNPQLRQMNLEAACRRIVGNGGTIIGTVYFDDVEITF